MMSRVCVALGVEVFLPSTETGQSGVCVVNDLQPFLQPTAELYTSLGTFLASLGFVTFCHLKTASDYLGPSKKFVNFQHCQLKSSNLKTYWTFSSTLV